MGQENYDSVLYGLKTLYTREYIDDAVYDEQPFFSIIEQNTEMQAGGRKWYQPIGIELPQGRSHTWAKSKANATGRKGVGFEFDYFDDFQTHLIDRKTLLRLQGGGDKSYFDSEVEFIDAAAKNLVRSLCVDLFRDGSGARGQVGAIDVGNKIITLKVLADITNFAQGQTLTAAQAKTTGNERNGAIPIMVITAVNEDAGQFTVDNLITGLLVDDWLFVEGDRNLAMPGLAAWIPDAAPTPATAAFGGVQRHVNVVRLAGSRVGAKNYTVSEAARKLMTKIDRAGGKSDLLVLNPTYYEQLTLEIASRGTVNYVTVPGQKANIFLEGFTIQGPKKKVTVISDFNCPEQRGYMLKKDDWFLACLGRKIPDIWDLDGNFMAWDVGSPGYEVRMDYYAVPICKDPRNQGVLKFDSTTDAT